MAQTATRAEGLGKRYQLGTGVAYGRLTETMFGALRSAFRPNERSGKHDDGFWALRDLSFEVERGEVLGIIGRNGAGKTTLLKVLSRITEPTEGYAEIDGRIGTLLEVGTGFHPELTGRENTYLNGAILGMNRREIDRRFDQIASFAEIDQFLDTPVKRYSSGMYVRLAFAVAAHLEPDVLIVDEVLAVGDVAFQKKCLQRMDQVAQEGRTVLFVSHNMAAIHRLCTRCLLLDGGKLVAVGDPQSVTASYIEGLATRSAQTGPREMGPISLRQVAVSRAGQPTTSFTTEEAIELTIRYEVESRLESVQLSVWFMTPEGLVVMSAFDTDTYPELLRRRDPGVYEASMEVPAGFLNAGDYLLRVLAFEPHGPVYDENVNHVLHITDEEGESANTGWGHRVGAVVPRFEWKMQSIGQPQRDG